MKTSTTAHTLPLRSSANLTIQARRIGVALFALAITALESWLRFPIQPVIESYLQSALVNGAKLCPAYSCLSDTQ